MAPSRSPSRHRERFLAQRFWRAWVIAGSVLGVLYGLSGVRFDEINEQSIGRWAIVSLSLGVLGLALIRWRKDDGGEVERFRETFAPTGEYAMGDGEVSVHSSEGGELTAADDLSGLLVLATAARLYSDPRRAFAIGLEPSPPSLAVYAYFCLLAAEDVVREAGR